MLRILYRTLWYIAAPLAVARLLVRSRHERGYIEHIVERFGYTASYAARNKAPLIWIHAVSLGETRAAEPLILAMLEEHPDAQILITHMTLAGRMMSEKLFGARVLRCYLPYDMCGPVRRFLRAWRPTLGIVLETEVWPTLIDECRYAGIPLVLTNARMSERSYQRAARFSSVVRHVFGGFSRVLAQSAADAQRLSALGAHDVVVLGNLKFDIVRAAELSDQGRAWHAAIGQRPVWVAGSTHEGEEALVLDAYRQLHIADALLVLVPRHPQRFDAVAELVKCTGLKLARRSQWPKTSMQASASRPVAIDPLPDDVQVLLGDSMGEMSAYYVAADVAFIGGSLLPIGGQNLIEACAIGVPVVIGPHTFNFEQVCFDAITAGAALRVRDPATLAQAVHTVLTNRVYRVTMGAAGAAFAARHRGATRRTLDELEALLPAPRQRISDSS
ncbi:lipid IV(A) 3-deoxy-D-manno-octulosonic acid transferase [Candidatus Vallotia cooleyia]|uniref:lipid IV(A) 3-deoxy-D-manno-octulosonic acid transferase n=1 Tax=Candidatus Vallotiella adelgis TaxID=1177211 RepID=UPI001D00EE05|nr:lipid IV(A) 3-deoxy-D-manno-octulosonic acid transferase [Candidatus Vallotia cooleyia]UDG82430.1 3-deoxy-D-manno-octulosonic acid transferase [Candidatus Vallotia cooleyia]